MLFTRCPNCETTFRITADALTKAEGRVRCGRCACVFNAHEELREQRFEASASFLTARSGSASPAHGPQAPGDANMGESALARTADVDTAASPETAVGSHDTAAGPSDTAARSTATVAASSDAPAESPPSAAPSPEAVAAESLPKAGAASQPDPAAATAAAAGARSAPTTSAVPLSKIESPRQSTRLGAPDSDVSFGDLTVAQVIRQIASGTVDDEDDAVLIAKTPAGAAVSERHVDEVLKQTASGAAREWQLLPDTQPPRPASRRWLYGSVCASALLGLQLVHHFRSQVAAMPIAGPALQSAYAFLGSEVTPQWNIGQYRIVDWVATAEPSASGQGSLKITARIQNKGPDAHPYPHVQVQLKDRWEGTIGSRFFQPSEYLPSNARRGVLMSPGATARAELEVVDPGPDAYGFELDICVEASAQNLRCSADVILPPF